MQRLNWIRNASTRHRARFTTSTSSNVTVSLSNEVQEAIAIGKPIVALESTIISHGMPYPRNIEVAQSIERTVRAHGAIPATIAIIDGIPKVGLTSDELIRLGDNSSHKGKIMKASRRDLAYAMSNRITAATTVASTMILAHLAGIRVFATGGIGGVHRGVESTLDISADLTELGKTPIAVVCGGVKSILDIPKTLEYLETQGVPVIGFQTKQFPAFFTNDSGIPSPLIADDTSIVAKMIHSADMLKLNHGFVIAVPNPNPAPSELITKAIEEATRVAASQGVFGHAITPFLLSAIEKITGGKSLDSNIALVLNNVKIASQIAVDFKTIQQSSTSLNNKSLNADNIDPIKTISVNNNSAPLSISTAVPSSKLLCVGGVVVDMIGSISSTLILNSSNPGTMRLSYGGVAFNICQHLSQYADHSIDMISAVGKDNFGNALLNYAKSIGIGTALLEEISEDISKTSTAHEASNPNHSNNRTATYTAIHGPNGDLCVAVADMSIFHQINSNHINKLASQIRLYDLLICDGNLSESAFASLINVCHTYYVPVFFEPTSDHKCVLPIKSKVLHRIDVIKPNLTELVMMIRYCLDHSLIIRNKAIVQNILKNLDHSFNDSINSPELTKDNFNDLRILAATLLHAMMIDPITRERDTSRMNNQLTSEGRVRRIQGKHVIVSLGQHGVLWCGSRAVLEKRSSGANVETLIIDDDFAAIQVPAIPLDTHKITHTNGAGDSFCGALVLSLFESKYSYGPTLKGIQKGLHAAKDHLIKSI